MKYDPVKSILAEKERIEKTYIQSELISENYGGIEINGDGEDFMESATAIKLSNLIEQKKCINGKELINSLRSPLSKSRPVVHESFKSLEYLKQVPKKIDCWLTKQSKNLSTPRNVKKELSTSRDKVEKLGDILKNSAKGSVKEESKINQSMNDIENFAEFSKNKEIRTKLRNSPEKSIKLHNLSKDFNYKSKMNESQLSGESFGAMNSNKSVLMFKTNLELNFPNQRRSPLSNRNANFNNEEECLEFLLEKLQYNSHVGMMSS